MKFLEFLGARCFDLRAAERRFEILKFAPELSNRFEILKFTLASARLADTAQNFISWNRFKILKFIQELPFAPCRVLPRIDSAGTGRTENFSKFDLAATLLNFISLPPRKFKLALLKFMREVSRDRSEILNFTPALRKFKSTPAVRLNFALNSVSPARAAKFENGVKFKGAAKFKRSAR